MKVDPYETLGIDAAATADEIKRAYRRRAEETHPDTCGEVASVKFPMIQWAYSLLSDPRRKRSYDRDGIDPGDKNEEELAVYNEAVSSVSVLFDQLIDAVLDDKVQSDSLLYLARANIGKGLDEDKHKLRKCERVIAKTKKLREKKLIRHRRKLLESDLYLMTLTRKLDQRYEEQAKLRHSIAVWEKMRYILEDYEQSESTDGLYRFQANASAAPNFWAYWREMK